MQSRFVLLKAICKTSVIRLSFVLYAKVIDRSYWDICVRLFSYYLETSC